MKKNFEIKKNLIMLSIILMFLAYVISITYIKYSKNNLFNRFGNLDFYNTISNYSFWWYILSSDKFGGFIYIFPPILVTISSYSFYKVYHTGFFHNIIQRIGYSKTFLIEFIKIWKYSLILPCLSLITLLIAKLLYSNSNILEYSETVGYQIQLVNPQMMKMNPYVFILLHMLLLMIFSLIIINISIILIRFIKKFYLIVTLTFISIIIYENSCNFIIAPFISRLTGIVEMYNGFSIYNLIYLDAIPNLIWEFIYSIILLIVTLVGIYLIYRKKEGVCLEYE